MVEHKDASPRVVVGNRPNPIVTAGIVVVAIVALYVGAGIFVPLVLAVLLAFALAPLVGRLRRLGLPHIAAVVLSVLMAALILATIGYVVATQVVKLAADLPAYQSTVAAKLKTAQETLGSGQFLERLGSAVSQLRTQVAPPAASGFDVTSGRPLPVTIANNPDNPLGMVQSILGSVLGPLATAAIVVVFLIFLLLERADLRDRFLKLVSRGDLRTSTKAMNEAAARVGRYLLVQFGVNLVYGIIFGTGLTLIGVPNGILWGLLATLFRYIPFVGTIVVAIIPFTLSFAVDPGWSMLLKSIALYAALELVTTNVIEPRLYGSSTGLSPLAVLVAAIFWATLWGPIGLILSTPLTVCLVVLGRYVPQLQFLETLLGSDPVLQPEQRLYQRLVAGNTEEALELAEEYIEAGDPIDFYTSVALPALRLAEADLSINSADLVQRRQVVESLEGMIDDLEDETEPPDDPIGVMVIGGRTELDGAGARILESILRRSGTAASSLPPLSIRREAIGQIDLGEAKVICIVYLGSNVRSYARFAARRLKRRGPSTPLIVCLFDGAAEPVEAASFGADAVATDPREVSKLINEWRAPEQIAPRRLEENRTSDLADRLANRIRSDAEVSAFLRDVAERLNVDAATANVLGTSKILSEDNDRPELFLERVIASGQTLVVPDVAKDSELAQDAFLLENGVQFCAGAPLRADQELIGVLAILDDAPRAFGEKESLVLATLADEFMRRFGEQKNDASMQIHLP